MAGTLYDAYLIQAQTAAADNNHTVVRPLEVYDACVTALATVGGGTVQVRKGAVALTDAMVCATDTNVVRAALLVAAQKTFAVGDTMNFFVNATGSSGLVNVHCFIPGSGAAG